MKGWNPFGKVDMEIGSFIKVSQFNKVYDENNDKKEIDNDIKQSKQEEEKMVE